MNATGFLNGETRIAKVNFPKGKIQLTMNDGRIIFCPLDRFPEIRRLPVRERKKYSNMQGLGIMFENSDEVYHISDFLGLHNTLGL